MQSVLTKSTTFPSLSCNKIEFKYLKPIWGKKKFEHQSAICARFCFSLKVHQGGKMEGVCPSPLFNFENYFCFISCIFLHTD